MLEVATDFYKNLFAYEPKPDLHLGNGFWSEAEMTSEEVRRDLERPFSEDEIKEAIMSSYASGAPGPDGLSFLFYQNFWDLIKNDFMWMVRDFENGVLDIYKLNYAIITLIPKIPLAREMKNFRPISLSNCAVKIFSKAMNTRASPICDKLISHNQTTFIKGRFILESVVMAHEVIHEVHISNSSGLILKLDYEKAYDRVSWDFLEEMLLFRGFGVKWVSWVLSTLKHGTFQVRINDTNGPHFVGGKGLKQGDPHSPLLFNLVADVFSKMLVKAVNNGLIGGLLPHAIPGGVVSLQYVDDTILFIQESVDYAKN
uniref:Reverse transcriptase domain-containing protein n=1 Tax=Aegilops tauschii subsp. strangulata TaxID=200361 RepID=A0A453BVE3_AEGTS